MFQKINYVILLVHSLVPIQKKLIAGKTSAHLDSEDVLTIKCFGIAATNRAQRVRKGKILCQVRLCQELIRPIYFSLPNALKRKNEC